MAVDLEEDRYSKEAVDARLRATEAAEDARALSEMENADPELKEIGDRNTPPNVGEAEAVGGGARWQKNPGWVDKTQPRVGAPMPTNAKLILRNVTKGKKGIIGIAGGIATAVLLGVFFLLPNQLKMAVENITESAARVPGYAIEQRTEYLMTRYIATRVMASVGGKDFDQKMIFCKNGGIACSLTSTKFAEAFDKRFKISTKPITSGAVMNIDIEIQPLSRSGLGGKAMSWNIKQTTTNTLDDQVDHIVRTIDNNKEMKAFLKAEVNRTYKKGFLSRLVGKNILMKRYGVTHFRGLEKTRNTTKKYLAGIGAKVTSNTVGKILPKLPVYFSCLEGGNSLNCEQAIQKASSALGDQIDELQKGIDNETSDTKKESLKKKQEGLKQLQKGIESPDLDGKTGKIIGKNILSKVAGPLAVASIIDLASRVIVSTDEHMLEVISYDIMGQAYVGLAYGDEVGIVPAVDQATVGESSVEGLGTLTSMVANMGAAPLYQYRTGQLKYSSESSYVAECEVEGEKKLITLPKGELVCPEEKMVKSYLGFTNDPWWQFMAVPAKIWKNTGGLLFDAIGWLTGPVVGAVGSIFSAITDLPGLSSIKEGGKELFSQAVEWLVNIVFGIPDIGMQGSSGANYTALDGGISQTMNDTMKHGIEDGELMGAGGRTLTSKEVSAINRAVLEDEKEEFNSQSTLAKIFDVNLKGSVFNKLALVTPRNFAGLLSLTPRLFGSINSTMSNDVFAADDTGYNPHGFPIYGYTASDKELTEDPSIYTDEYCEASAKKREKSYKIYGDDVLPTYGVSDGCALEKIATGYILNEFEVTDDENSLKEPDGGGSASDTTSSSSNEGDLPPVEGWTWPIKDQLRAGPCWNRPVSGRLHAGMDINSGKPSAPLYAMHDATVIEAVSGGGGAAGNYIIFKSTDGLYFIYQHLSSISVKAGQTVKANQFVGRGGKTGNVQANSPVHLHVVVSKEDPSKPGQFPSYGKLRSSINPMSVLPKPAPDNYKCT